MSRVLVIGAGVLGLSCALRLLQAGHRVDVMARDLPRETTSATAAAIWYPYLAAPADRVLAWSAAAYREFARIAEQHPTAGVVMRQGTEVFAEPVSAGGAPDPWWRSAVPQVDRQTALPPGYADGLSFAAPVVEMPLYLDWLRSRVEEEGGTVTRLNLSGLPSHDGVVVNCAGLGARLMAADGTVTPVRGQVVYVEQVGLEEWWLEESGPTYVVPRSRDIVVGGTELHDEWSRTPDPATAEHILERARALVPQLRGARVLGHKVGLRPARAEVRLERVGDVVHCYGHGGSGVTQSWGCADEVAELVGAGS